MTLKPERRSERAIRWWSEANAHSPRVFTAGVLSAAVVLALGHYTFGDWVVYPEVALWRERAFWTAMPSVVAVPVVHWLAWTLVSLGRLKPAPVILLGTAVLCLGDLVWYLVWLNLKAAGLDYQRFVGYWDWWTCWLPVVLLAGNLALAQSWWKSYRPARGKPKPQLALLDVCLRAVAVFVASWALLLAAIHLVVPRMALNDFTLAVADEFLVRQEWRADFDFVVRNSVSRGKRLGAILDHAELANLQRRHFYQDLDEQTYQQFVLSPVVDRLPLSELDWRRTLWENFYPRVRRERDPALAAVTVARFLRERVGIDPGFGYRVGVETIWRQQMTDESGFERIYVAALRSVGVVARLNERRQTELWDGSAWRAAPRPVIASWAANAAFTEAAHFSFSRR